MSPVLVTKQLPMKKIVHFYLVFLVGIPFTTHGKEPLSQNSIFNAHLAGNWYEKEPAHLNEQIDAFLKDAENEFPVHIKTNTHAEAFIVPHAGYEFSGLNAATAYQTLLHKKGEKNRHIRRVIILGTNHYSPNEDIVMPDFSIYQTPLGKITIDTVAIQSLKNNPLFKVDNAPFTTEHSVEIQLPFIQKTVAKYKLIPLIVGAIPEDKIIQAAHAIKNIIDKETLVIVSSDFTHFGPNYNYLPFSKRILGNIRAIDSAATEAIIAASTNQFDEVIKKTAATICGQHPIKLLLTLISLKTWGTITPQLTCYYTSAQMEKARKNRIAPIDFSQLLKPLPDHEVQNSVSYISMVFTDQNSLGIKPKNRLTGYEKKALITLAQETIKNRWAPAEEKLSAAYLFPIKSLELSRTPGAFVTINKKNGDLRGCIGTVITEAPLYQTVYQMSHAAAFEDSRFVPLSKKELSDITIGITILEKPVPVKSWQDIVIGKHGIILEKNGRSALFLPQVAREQNWDLPTTLKHLALKAGLRDNAWKEGAIFKVFEGYEIKENSILADQK